MEKKKVFEPIDRKTPPENIGYYGTINKFGVIIQAYWNGERWGYFDVNMGDGDLRVVSWLKEIEAYTLTDGEMRVYKETVQDLNSVLESWVENTERPSDLKEIIKETKQFLQNIN